MKEIQIVIKLQLPAGQANPAPPVGPALGQHGVNIMDFCQKFNAKTQTKSGTILPVEITVYKDRTFDFIVKQPPVAEMIKKELNLEKGAATTGKERVGVLSRASIRKIAQIKMSDLNAKTIEAAEKIVEGTARSMGVSVEG
jgi:large subunit ribosomal protein L11